MRLLVISDTHGHLDSSRKVIEERGPWDHLIHLGDSALDAVSLAADLSVDIMALRGNNEYPGAPDPKDELIFDAGGVRFFAVHGHQPDMNFWDRDFEHGLAEISRRAAEAGARVALFGHTHVPLIRELGGVLIINPGGLGLGDRKRTYAVVEVDDRGEAKAEIEEAD